MTQHDVASQFLPLYSLSPLFSHPGILNDRISPVQDEMIIHDCVLMQQYVTPVSDEQSLSGKFENMISSTIVSRASVWVKPELYKFPSTYKAYQCFLGRQNFVAVDL